MRIRSIAIRNYRVHRELKLDLDPARTLIAGPNESGKSTLIEAVHRAFFLRARTSGEMQKSMISRLHPGHPEVEVWFEAAGKVHRILKRFSGATGTTTLMELNGEMWCGEHAESRLAKLLGVEPGAAKGGATQWAHLWIWQRCAGDDPTEHVNRECAPLLARLQEEGGAALMQSECDARVAEHFTRKHDEIFNRNGDPRAPSQLARALLEEAFARKVHADAEVTVRRLHDAAEEMRAADETINDCEKRLKELDAEQAKIDERVARVQVLQRAEETATFALAAAAEKEELFAEAEERLHALQADLATRNLAFAPHADATVRLTQLESDCRLANVRAEEAYQRAIAELRDIRTRHNFVSAHIVRMEKAKQRDELAVKLVGVREMRGILAALEASLAELPKTSDATLESLRAAEKRCSNAAAALETIATGIEIVATEAAVVVGERRLAAGESLILAEESELRIGDSIRIRIRPGGGTSLEEARKEVCDAQAALSDQLRGAGFGSIAQFAEASAARGKLEIEMQTLRARLEAL
ncbi:MAG TPA: AAA family ATPase, partial [Chthoniobacteraceae bacterium]|nr:AAA family ATPase [Chthoniobacteraceae bacterium]